MMRGVLRSWSKSVPAQESFILPTLIGLVLKFLTIQASKAAHKKICTSLQSCYPELVHLSLHCYQFKEMELKAKPVCSAIQLTTAIWVGSSVLTKQADCTNVYHFRLFGGTMGHPVLWTSLQSTLTNVLTPSTWSYPRLLPQSRSEQ